MLSPDTWLLFNRDLTLVILPYTWISVLMYLTCSSCYNNQVNSRKLIIMDTIVIIRQLTPGWEKLMSIDIVSMFIMVLKCRTATYLWFYLEATRCFRGVYWHPHSHACQVYHKSLGLFLWERWYPIPIRSYNKSWYLAVRSVSVPDTPWSLSRACTSKHGSSISISFQ